MEPTDAAYGELRLAYDTFNQQLFDGQLPPCLLTLQRKKRTHGYFSPKRFGTRRGETTDEIALNPEYFAVTPLLETLQTIAHEMVHLWQAHFGTRGRARYHNAEWADKMESIGLMPSSTGKPGGRRVGDRVSDYVIPGGRFAAVAQDLLANHDFGITWYDRFAPSGTPNPVPEADGIPGLCTQAFEVAATTGVEVVHTQGAQANRSNREKYNCVGCGLNVWGKPGIRVSCMDCGIELEAVVIGTSDLGSMAPPRASAAASRAIGGARAAGRAKRSTAAATHHVAERPAKYTA